MEQTWVPHYAAIAVDVVAERRHATVPSWSVWIVFSATYRSRINLRDIAMIASLRPPCDNFEQVVLVNEKKGSSVSSHASRALVFI